MNGTEEHYESVYLVADVGGTNTSIALVGRRGRRFRIIAKDLHQSQRLTTVEAALDASIDFFRRNFAVYRPISMCISGAGPVAFNLCRPTNLPWHIDGDAIAERYTLPCRVINDFSAVSYSLPLLDVGDANQVAVLSPPEVHGAGRDYAADALPAGGAAGAQRTTEQTIMRAVVGAGTGLGVGFLLQTATAVTAFPSEAGHIDLAPADPLVGEAAAWLAETFRDGPLGAEAVVSGNGIAALYRFVTRDAPGGTVVDLVRAAAPSDQAAVIARHSTTDADCRRVMQAFVRQYARFAASIALTFLPNGGLYLAGGIAAKNLALFVENGTFIREFQRNYLPGNRALLANTPVYLVRDYAVSLLGAAHAAFLAAKPPATPAKPPAAPAKPPAAPAKPPAAPAKPPAAPAKPPAAPAKPPAAAKPSARTGSRS